MKKVRKSPADQSQVDPPPDAPAAIFDLPNDTYVIRLRRGRFEPLVVVCRSVTLFVKNPTGR